MRESSSQMIVDLASVEDRKDYAFRSVFPIADREGNDLGCSATVAAQVTRMGGRFLLTASIAATVRVECSRCTAPFDMPLEAEFSIVFHRGQIPQGMDEDDLVPLTGLEDDCYDLFPRVREAVILETPIRFLCSEECKGLCPRCGVNRNEATCECEGAGGDPRWGDLKKLLNEDGK